MKTTHRTLIFLLALASLPGRAPLHAAPPPPADPREVHLTDLRQLTAGGENAEAYWSPDGSQLVFQSTHPPYACDQIFRLPAGGAAEPTRVSTGKGRTTCGYFTADSRRVLFSSTHHASPACPEPPDRSQGYVWPVDTRYEIWSARPDGSDLVRLTDNDAYDAETTVCPADGSLIFTSTRDGDLDLYRMSADGGQVRRLTREPGYDGGAFFSPDCSKIVWRASRPRAGEELEDYRRLLGRGLVRPSQLEIWVADVTASGISNPRQVTSLGAAAFAPSFFPQGDRIIFSSNHADPAGRDFDLWAVNLDGSGLERITYAPGFDGFPMFSPDGRFLAFASNRVQSAPGETNVFVARWAEGQPAAAGGRFLADVRWLADDAREGRGIGTRGLEESAQWLAGRFRETGLEPAGDDGTYLQRFEVPVAVEAAPGTAMSIDGRPVPKESFDPAPFGTSAQVAGEVVAAGYGITAAELGVDDYKGLDVRGKIVVVRRFLPEASPFTQPDTERRYSGLRYKAWNAREHGAKGLVIVDFPDLSKVVGEPPAEAAVRFPRSPEEGDAGIPVVMLTRELGAPLFEGGHRASLDVELVRRYKPAANVVGVIRAGAADRLPGAVVVGAHYDHLGLGGSGSLAPDAREPHNGADDNASGTAALLEVARRLGSRRAELRRDVWLVAFSAEEEGLLGSAAWTRKLPAGLAAGDLVAMLNMDMVGRLRDDKLSVFGGDSAEEWSGLVQPSCRQAGLTCALDGDGFGPSDHSTFYAAGVPVLHFFTGVHDDYHKPSDDADKINAEGGVRVAGLVADVAGSLAGRGERLTYKSAPAPAPQGDQRSYGASLGTVPDYAGDGRPGVLLAGVRPQSAAEKAGIRRGDLLVELAGTPIRDIQDFMFVLRKVKPGDTSTAVVMRGDQRLELPVTFGGNSAVR
ncbi:MAG TPA: M28 family peptidase [Thermoanaerobaculia bacterium]|nr:M28 family peptidase [Thermoanaerobaculia bacterium]